MPNIGPHNTTVPVALGECPACKKPIVALVTASVSVIATGRKPTSDDAAVVRLSAGDVKVAHATVKHNCGPQEDVALSDSEHFPREEARRVRDELKRMEREAGR